MQTDDKNKKGLDIETKLRLLITLINDEGKEKLTNNLEKLINRLNEYKESHFETIIDIFVKTICQIPMKTGIYAYCLYKIFKLTFDRVLIEEIVSGLLKKLQEGNFSDEMIPKRIIRFLYESFKYGLISKEILEKFSNKVFNFDNYANEDQNLIKIIYLFVSNFPYIFNSLSDENKEIHLNKLNDANNLLKNNALRVKINQYRNKGDFDYLENMTANYILAAKENKLNSDLILDLSGQDNSDDEWKMPQEEQDEEYLRNLNNLHTSLNHVFESDLPNKLNLENCKYKIITNTYFDLGTELEKINPTILNEDIFLSDFDKILLREAIEDIFSAFHRDLSIAFVTYLTKISSFFSFKKNLDFSILIHLINIAIRTTPDNLRVLETANLTNRFLLVSSNYSNAKFNANVFKEICFLIIDKYIPEKALVSSAIENFAFFLGFVISNQEFNFAYEKIAGSNSMQTGKIELFKKSLIDRLCALGTQGKIVGFLTEDLRNYLPQENKPYWKFTPNEQFYYDTDVINDNIQYKKEFSTWSEKFESTGGEFIYILCSCLFYSKSKTLSHLRESLLFFRDAITHYINSNETQSILLNALFDVWGHSDTYLKFLIEFLLNQNIIDHVILVKFIFLKLKDLVTPDFQDQIQNTADFHMSKNYSMFNFVDAIILHCEKSLERLKNELSKEQSSLAISDETLQTGIIKSIEFLEENIEKNILANRTIHGETLRLYLDLYFTIGEDNEKEKGVKNTESQDTGNNRDKVNAEEREFLLERIVLFVQKNSRKVEEQIGKIKENYTSKDKRIDDLFDNMPYIN